MHTNSSLHLVRCSSVSYTAAVVCALTFSAVWCSQDLNPAYNMLLRSELLGYQCPSPISPDKATQLEQLKSPCSPAKKILRFKSGDASSPVAGPPPQSPFLTSPVGVDSLVGSPVMSPRRPPRKIPRAPFKVHMHKSQGGGALLGTHSACCGLLFNVSVPDTSGRHHQRE